MDLGTGLLGGVVVWTPAANQQGLPKRGQMKGPSQATGFACMLLRSACGLQTLPEAFAHGGVARHGPSQPLHRAH